MPEPLAFEVHTDFNERLLWLIKRVDVALVGALGREAERLMTMAKMITPVDTGALRSSGRVEGPINVTSHGATFVLAYGGVALDYALRVHEDLGMHHDVGQAKFLETPVREETGSGRSAARIQMDLNAQGLI
jgi:hypothetical protein